MDREPFTDITQKALNDPSFNLQRIIELLDNESDSEDSESEDLELSLSETAQSAQLAQSAVLEPEIPEIDPDFDIFTLLSDTISNILED
jgi:hypothetical protein